LKYFLEVDFSLFLLTIQKGVCIPPPLNGKKENNEVNRKPLSETLKKDHK
jgi:hypothetical protein